MNRSVRLPIILFGMLAAATFNGPAGSQPKVPDIGYYEVVDFRFEFERAPEEAELHADTATLEFYAFGRQFDAELRRNVRLIRRLPAAQARALADVTIWEGELPGLVGSWVRLTQQGEFFSGAIHDGTWTYRIERYELVSHRLVSQQPGLQDSTVIYAVTGSFAIGSDILVEPEASAVEQDPAEGTRSLAPGFKPALTQGLEVELGAVGDVEFVSRYGSRAAAQAVSQINVADAIFVQQLGVHLAVAEVRMFEMEPDPFRSSNAETALQEMAAFKVTTVEFAPLDVAHLFTDKELDDGIVGIANLATVCATRDGVSLSTDGWAVAHEVAHNLGAPHDAESGSPCEREPPGYLMDPTFQGGNTTTFSACSIEAMRQTVSSADCLSPLPASDILLSVAAAPLAVAGNAPFDVYFEASGAGTEDMFAIEVTFEASAALITEVYGDSNSFQVDCQTGQMPVRCTTHRIESGRTVSFRVTVQPTQAGQLTVSGSVSSLNDSDATNNEAEAVVDVEPTINLIATEPVVLPEVAVPGDMISVSTTVTNVGLADATDIEIRIDEMPEFAEFVTAELSNGGPCVLQMPSNAWLCPVGNLQMGQELSARFDLRALDPGTAGNVTSEGQFTLGFRGAETDIGPGSSSATISVNSAIVEAALLLERRGSLVQGQRFHVDFTIENHGPDSIDGAYVDVLLPGVEIDIWDDAFCSVTPESSTTRCEIRQLLEPGASKTFYVSGLLTSSGSFVGEATMSFTARDPELGNNSATLAYTVSAVQSGASSSGGGGSGGGGGGGAMSPAWILLLAAGWCWALLFARARPCGRSGS